MTTLTPPEQELLDYILSGNKTFLRHDELKQKIHSVWKQGMNSALELVLYDNVKDLGFALSDIRRVISTARDKQ